MDFFWARMKILDRPAFFQKFSKFFKSALKIFIARSRFSRARLKISGGAGGGQGCVLGASEVRRGARRWRGGRAECAQNSVFSFKGAFIEKPTFDSETKSLVP